MTFGNDWAYKQYLFPAFVLTESNEAEYALKMRISVFDQRKTPRLGLWAEWGSAACGLIRPEQGPCLSCDGVCGANMYRTRRRLCDCPLSATGATQKCFDCEEILDQDRGRKIRW